MNAFSFQHSSFGWPSFQWGMLAQTESVEMVESVLMAPWPIPIWISILLGIGVSIGIVALYFSERGKASPACRALLAAIRMSLLLLVFWMLAGWSWLRFKSDRPELLILVDRSASMQTVEPKSASSEPLRPDSPSRFDLARGKLLNIANNATKSILSNYRLRWMTIADSVQPFPSRTDEMENVFKDVVPDGPQSRLGDGISRVLEQQTGLPTAAMVLVSDGIVTGGISLDEAAERARLASIPIYTIVAGEQLPHPDLQITDLLADDAVFLGDRVMLQATVAATDIRNQTSKVSLVDARTGEVFDSKSIELSEQKSLQTVQLSFVPSAPGAALVRVSVSPTSNERVVENNSVERSIEVRDQMLRVLLVQRTPSFEYRFLKTLLQRTEQLGTEQRKAFDVKTVLQDSDVESSSQDESALRLVPGDVDRLSEFDVFVFGDFDSSLVPRSTQQLIADAVITNGCGLIFICDPALDHRKLAGSPLGGLLPMEIDSPRTLIWTLQESARTWNPTQLGSTSLPLQLAPVDNSEGFWRSLPGPHWIYRIQKVKVGAQVLAEAVDQSKDHAESLPLLISQFAGAGRVALQTTDETFRWTSFRGSDAIYQRYWVQTLRWLSRGKLSRGDTSELSVEPKRVRVGEAVQISAKLSKAAISSLGTRPCVVRIERIGMDPTLKELNRVPNSTNLFKSTEASLSAGNYRISLQEPSDSTGASATLTVVAPPGEQANLRADWDAMRTLAERSRGRFETLDNADRIFEQLPPGSPVRRGTLPPEPLWNHYLAALAFVVLITSEWLLRRSANML